MKSTEQSQSQRKTTTTNTCCMSLITDYLKIQRPNEDGKEEVNYNKDTS